jgi:signal peptidase I
VSVVAFGPRVPFSRSRFPALHVPERGDLVVIQAPALQEPGMIARVLEPLVGFFTLQRATLRRDVYGARVNGYMVKRIIGLPGDTIRLKDFVASIRPRGASSFAPEQQLIPGHYQIVTAQPGKGWSSSLPLSGSTGDIELPDDAYFVLGDNRPESSDSRSWGAVTMDRIIGKVLYRYWPPRSIGVP